GDATPSELRLLKMNASFPGLPKRNPGLELANAFSVIHSYLQFSHTLVTAEVKNRIEEGPVWVVSDNHAIVGTVSVVAKGESLYVRGMAIVPAARGRRIGELLLKQVEDFAAERGFKRRIR
ncbi:MAG TPA: GNAT family N-acetyltransferase, partial [Pyrinomonadaceae bacterium]|nr:GNAT family N-acetyltransferase [Pyrinomonadaceae bacterium]